MNGKSNRGSVCRELPAGARQRQEAMKLVRELSTESCFAGRMERMPTVTGEARCWMRIERPRLRQ